MVWQPDNKRPKRNPSLRDAFMMDTVHGSVRIRAWPKKRGPPKSEVTTSQNNWFRDCSWAIKYWPAMIMDQITQARDGTPLLPRDVAMMIQSGKCYSVSLQNQGTIYSVQVLKDVSASLDVITQTPGAMLVRGEQYWEQGSGGGGSEWVLREMVTITSPTQKVEFKNIPPCQECNVLGRLIALSSSTQINLQFSDNNGVSYYNTVGNYARIEPAGTETAFEGIYPYTPGASAGRSFTARLFWPSLLQSPKLVIADNRPAPYYFVGTPNPINAIKVQPAGIQNMISGTLYLFTR